MAVELTHVLDGVVMSVHQAAEAPVLARMASQLSGNRDLNVVVDLSDLTMAPLEGAETLVEHIRCAAAADGRQRWSLVAERMTARRILCQLCAGSTIGVFPDVESALAGNSIRGVDR